jgi:hypothetical protein
MTVQDCNSTTMEQVTISLLNNAQGVVHHYHTMTGRLNWAIALGRHDVQHVVSALSRCDNDVAPRNLLLECSSWNEISSEDNMHVLRPKTTTAMAQSNGNKVCQLMQLLQLAQEAFSLELIASLDGWFLMINPLHLHTSKVVDKLKEIFTWTRHLADAAKRTKVPPGRPFTFFLKARPKCLKF